MLKEGRKGERKGRVNAAVPSSRLERIKRGEREGGRYREGHLL